MGEFRSFKSLLTRAKECGLKLTIHCAEVHGYVNDTKEILEYEGVDRIGHGTFLDGKWIEYFDDT